MTVPDRGRPVEFGIFPVPEVDALHTVREQVRVADEAGLDLVGVQDHPYQRRYVDTFTLIATLAAGTQRVRFFPDVANLPLRGAAMLAKESASIDVLSGGRFELGLGAGGFWDAIEGLGGPRRDPGEAVQALEEAIGVIRALWSGRRGLRVDGDHYHLAGVHSGPVPAHDVGIWIGAYGPRMLALTGRLGDGWVPSSAYLPPHELDAKQAQVDEAAQAAGRDPADVRRVYNISGTITDGASDGFLSGPPQQWVEQLGDLVTTTGMDTFVLWAEQDPVTQTRRFAEEVAPGVREAVGTYRR